MARATAARHDRPEAAWLPDQERWLADALLALFEANRVDGEAYTQCFQRVGAPGYATYLTDLLQDSASNTGPPDDRTRRIRTRQR